MTVGPLHVSPSFLRSPVSRPAEGGCARGIRAGGVRAAALLVAVAAHAAVLAGLVRPGTPAVDPPARLVMIVPAAGVPTPREATPREAMPSMARMPDDGRSAPAAASPRRARPTARVEASSPASVVAAQDAAAAAPVIAPPEPDLPLRAIGQPVTLAAAPARADWPVRVTRRTPERLTVAGGPEAVPLPGDTGRFAWDDAAGDGWRIRLEAGDGEPMAADGRWTADGPATRRVTVSGQTLDTGTQSAAIDPLTATLLVGMAIRGTPSLTRPDSVIELPAAGAGRLRYRVVGAEQIEVAGAEREALRLSRIDASPGAAPTLRDLWLETAYAWLPLRFDLESAGGVWRVEATADLPR